MKVKVLTSFIDIHTDELYAKDSIIDVDQQRFEEITAKGNYIQPVEENIPENA